MGPKVSLQREKATIEGKWMKGVFTINLIMTRRNILYTGLFLKSQIFNYSLCFKSP